MIRPIFLSFLLTLLLALPAAGQALGLGELIWLRRVSAKKAARLLTRQGWRLESVRKDNNGFKTQTWVPLSNGSADSTRISLQLRHSWWRPDQLVYTMGYRTAGSPGRMRTHWQYENGERTVGFPCFLYTKPFPSRAGRSLRLKRLYGNGSMSMKYRDGGCGFLDDYIGASPWVTFERYSEAGTPNNCHCVAYTLRANYNPVTPLLLALMAR